jgi:hypothetical protein
VADASSSVTAIIFIITGVLLCYVFNFMTVSFLENAFSVSLAWLQEKILADAESSHH